MIERVTERLKAWEKGNKPGPYSIQLNPTNRCNLKCRFCWQRTNEEIDYSEVGRERYLDLVDEAKDLGVKKMEITGGGEPLIRKELTLDLIEHVKEFGMEGKLITNGTDLKTKDLKRIVGVGWDEVVFSVDGTEETHDRLRQVEGCFKDTTSSMEKLDELRNNGSSEMTLHMVLCKENYNELDETLRIAEDCGCDNFFVEPIVTLAFDTDIGKKLKMDREEVEKAVGNIEEAKGEAEKMGMNHNLGDLKEELIGRTNEMDEVVEEDASEARGEGVKGAACFEPWYNMIIRPEGDVGPCCMFDNQGPNIKENSLEEVWFGDYFQNIRQNMMNHELLSFCSKCNPSQVTRNREIRRYFK